MKTFITRLYQKVFRIRQVARELGADAASRRKLFWGGLWFLINDTWKTRYRFTARLSKYGRTIPFHFEDLGDYELLQEALIEEIYALDGIDDPETIVDLGSNVGASVLYFRLRYPDAAIYGFEPDPNNFRRLMQNTDDLEGVHLREVAAWSTDGVLQFYADPHRGSSSSLFRVRPRQEEVRVEACSLDTLLQDAGIKQVDVLKFDIEGAEREVLRAAQCLDRVDVIVGEVHSDIGASHIEAIRALLPPACDTLLQPISAERHLLVASQSLSSVT